MDAIAESVAETPEAIVSGDRSLVAGRRRQAVSAAAGARARRPRLHRPNRGNRQRRPAAGRSVAAGLSPSSTCGSRTATGSTSISALKKRRPDARGIVLTGYGNIATAVTAVKLGAFDYLSKPADADEVAAALLATAEKKTVLPENPMSADRVRWEHIQRIYELCDRNVSETARRLNMHRRTLQRILAKRAPK